jgi:hypothetical protein
MPGSCWESDDGSPQPFGVGWPRFRVLFRWLERGKLVAANPFAGLELSIRLPNRLPRALTTVVVLAFVGTWNGASRGLANGGAQ